MRLSGFSKKESAELVALLVQAVDMVVFAHEHECAEAGDTPNFGRLYARADPGNPMWNPNP